MKLIRRKTADHLPMGVPLACFVLIVVLSAPATAYSQDAIYQYRTNGGAAKISGKITDVSPEGATVGNKQIPAAEIKRLHKTSS